MKKIFVISVIFVLFALVMPICVSGISANGWNPEDVNINITIELTPDAHRNITIHAEIPTTFSSGGFDVLNNASVQLDILSPAPGQLQVTGSCSVTFTQPVDQNMDVQLAQIALTYSTMPSVVNSYLQELLGPYMENLGDRFSGLADLQLENISVTSFNWQSPTLSAGMSMTFSGAIFENQKLRDKLPISISGNLNISATEIRLRIEGSNANANGWIELNAANNTLTIDAFLSLPSEVIGELVNPNVGLDLPLGNLENTLANLENTFEGVHITTTLIVPDGSNIENLQAGYTQGGNSYTWSGENAMKAIADVITGQPLANVSYKYVPPSSYTLLIVAALLAIIVPIAIAAVILKRRR
jgi:hypothetical protein